MAGTATPQIQPGIIQVTQDKPKSGLEPGYLVICWNDPVNYMVYVTHVFQTVFGMIFTVIIALEFKRSLLVVAERQHSVVQVRTVVLIALLAIVRKLLILDVAHATNELFALAAAIIALGAVYWLVRDQDRSIAGEGFARQRNQASRVGRGKKASSSEK